MTIVEFFDKYPFDNIMNCITFSPDKVIFIGFGTQMDVPIKNYTNYLQSKHIETQIEKICLENADIDKALSLIKSIIIKEPNCIFDITGGNELFAYALGMLKEQLKGEDDFVVRQINMKSNKVIDFFDSQCESALPDCALTFDELVFLFGGAIKSSKKTDDIVLNENAIEKIWNISKYNSKIWNENIQILKEFEKHLSLSDGNLHYLSTCVRDYDSKRRRFFSFINELKSNGLVYISDPSYDHYAFEYTNDFVKSCFEKAGNALELKVCAEAKKFRNNRGSSFHEVSWSVTVDWDGIIPSFGDYSANTVNEIDVVAMMGTVPLFISCKNGAIGDAELYKLSSVADRFGGERAKKLLIATELAKESRLSRDSFLQRAGEMNIFVVPNAGKLHECDWKNVFSDAMR